MHSTFKLTKYLVTQPNKYSSSIRAAQHDMIPVSINLVGTNKGGRIVQIFSTGENVNKIMDNNIKMILYKYINKELLKESREDLYSELFEVLYSPIIMPNV